MQIILHCCHTLEIETLDLIHWTFKGKYYTSNILYSKIIRAFFLQTTMLLIALKLNKNSKAVGCKTSTMSWKMLKCVLAWSECSFLYSVPKLSCFFNA